MSSVSELLRSFRHPGFGLVWSSICLNGWSSHVSTIAISWLALEFTGSPVGVGIALATRVLPRLFLAIPFGSLSDRRDRRVLLQATNTIGAGMAALAAIASLQGWFGFGSVILVATFVGVFDVAETTLAKSFVYDVVGPDDAVNGMALEQLANKLFGVIGGVTTGIVMSLWGGVGAFVMMSIAYGCSAFLLMLMPRVAPTAGSFREVASLADGEADDEQPAIWESMLQLLQTPSVLVFAVIALAGEVFAYSHEALAPSFARDILNVGERGLGPAG